MKRTARYCVMALLLPTVVRRADGFDPRRRHIVARGRVATGCRTQRVASDGPAAGRESG